MRKIESIRIDTKQGLEYEDCFYYNKVKPELVARLGRLPKDTLTDNELYRIESKLQDVINKPKSKVFPVVGVIALIVGIWLFNIGGWGYLMPLVMPAIPATPLVLFLALTGDKRFAAPKLAALKEGKYAAYRFDVLKKMWHKGSGRNGSSFTHLIVCDRFCFEVYSSVYEKINDKAVVVLYYLEKRTMLEVFVPDDTDAQDRL